MFKKKEVYNEMDSSEEEEVMPLVDEADPAFQTVLSQPKQR